MGDEKIPMKQQGTRLGRSCFGNAEFTSAPWVWMSV